MGREGLRRMSLGLILNVIVSRFEEYFNQSHLACPKFYLNKASLEIE